MLSHDAFWFHNHHYKLYTPHFTLHTSHFPLYTPHLTFPTLHSTVYTPQFTLHTLHSTLYTPHLTIHTLHSTLYTPHFIVAFGHFLLQPEPVFRKLCLDICVSIKRVSIRVRGLHLVSWYFPYNWPRQLSTMLLQKTRLVSIFHGISHGIHQNSSVPWCYKWQV